MTLRHKIAWFDAIQVIKQAESDILDDNSIVHFVLPLTILRHVRDRLNGNDEDQWSAVAMWWHAQDLEEEVCPRS